MKHWENFITCNENERREIAKLRFETDKLRKFIRRNDERITKIMAKARKRKQND
jgi:hypothetical protein